ncbi:MAG: ABC transporter permease, partial [Fusobacteriaceae bacterium]
MNKRKTSLFFFVFSMLFFYFPLMLLIIYSFNDGKAMAWKGFSLKWYKELFMYSDNIWNSFKYSIIIAILSSAISTTIGTLAAIGLQWY